MYFSSEATGLTEFPGWSNINVRRLSWFLSPTSLWVICAFIEWQRCIFLTVFILADDKWFGLQLAVVLFRSASDMQLHIELDFFWQAPQVCLDSVPQSARFSESLPPLTLGDGMFCREFLFSILSISFYHIFRFNPPSKSKLTTQSEILKQFGAVMLL